METICEGPVNDPVFRKAVKEETGTYLKEYLDSCNNEHIQYEGERMFCFFKKGEYIIKTEVGKQYCCLLKVNAPKQRYNNHFISSKELECSLTTEFVRFSILYKVSHGLEWQHLLRRLRDLMP